MLTLTQFALASGFSVENFVLDGAIHRFDRRGEKNAWYVGWQHLGTRSGEAFQICVLGDWKTGEKIEYSPTEKLSKEDKVIVKKKVEDAQRIAEALRTQRQDEARRIAADLVARSRPVAKSAYLERKKIGLCGAGTVLDDNGRTIIVPMRDIDGELWGAQKISEDGNKRFVFCQKVTGTFHVIGSIDDPFLYICEGFATGASIHEATGKSVVVAFNAGNLGPVAQEIRRRYTAATIVIAGDDDVYTDGNPGRTKATAAGNAVFPVFKNPEKGKTDFNDLAVDEGLAVVAGQLLGDEPEPSGYIPLGHDGSHHFFFIMKTKQIKAIRQFSEVECYSLRTREDWSADYPGKTSRVDWGGVKSDLVQLSDSAGIFDSSRIRGTGVWWDNGRVIINNGRSLLVDGQPAASVDGWYRYITTVNRTPDLSKPLSVAECRPILDACSHFKWNDEKSFLFLAGHIAIARIAGALKVRPHCWITGGSESGKSTVMRKCIFPCLGDKKGWLQAQGATTEAGLRQTIGCSSLPVIFDEFETTGGYTAERIANTLELFRSSWEANDGVVIKGSSGGAATAYQLAFPAIVASIRVPLLNDADKSRFCVLELAPHGNDVAHYKKLESLLDALNPDLGERLFARSCRMVKTIRASCDVFSRVLARAVSQRYGQQVGTVLAGWYSLVSDEAVTQETAESVVADMNLEHERDSTHETDDAQCENHLLTWKVSFRGAGMTTDRTIGEAIGLKGFEEELVTYGIKVKGSTYVVANNHAELSKIYAGTQWARSWSRSLARRPGAKACQTSFGSRESRSRGVELKVW